MEQQLIQLNTEYPALFPSIQRAINESCRRAQDEVNQFHGSKFIKKRQGYADWLRTEPILDSTISELGIQDISCKRSSNRNNSSLHLEIHTPHAVLVFAQVPKGGTVPRRAKYRQEYIDQCCMWEWMPDMKPYTTNCRPLYVVTHSLPKDYGSMPDIYIGRLNSSQDSWSCNYPISSVIAETTAEGSNANKPKVAVREDIFKGTNIRLKNA